jgi:hypothetical protein
MSAATKPKSGASKARRPLFYLEHRRAAVLPLPDFLRRMLVSLALGFGVIGASLAVGMLGYHWTEGLDGMDSFINAAMILSGMGPLWDPATSGGKLFAGLYALYSGLAVLAVAGVIFAPLVHRMLHRFHADPDDASDKSNQ